MAFVVKKTNLDEMDSTTGTFTYEPDNITITIRSFYTPQFQKASELIVSRDRETLEALSKIEMGNDFLDAVDTTDKSVDEMLARAVGKFLIAAWDVETEDGEVLEINADNFILVMNSIPKPFDFLQFCYERAGDVAIENSKTITDTKKKPSRATSGKKTTKA